MKLTTIIVIFVAIFLSILGVYTNDWYILLIGLLSVMGIGLANLLIYRTRKIRNQLSLIQVVRVTATDGSMSEVTTIQRILESAGFQVVDESATKHDATLSLDVIRKPLSALYIDRDSLRTTTHYSGMSVYINVNFWFNKKIIRSRNIYKIESPASKISPYSYLRPGDAPRIVIENELIDAIIYLLRNIGRTDCLIQLLKDYNVIVCQSAIKSLPRFGRNRREYVQGYIEALGSRYSSCRQVAANALGKIGANASEVIPAIQTSLRDADKNLFHSAIKALGRIGATKERMIQAYIEALKSSDLSVLLSAIKGLSVFDDEDVVKALTQILEHEVRDVRQAAAGALGEIGLKAKDAIPELIASLKNADKKFYRSVIETLNRIGANKEQKVQAYTVSLRIPHNNVRRDGINGLVASHSNADEVVSAFISALEDSDIRIRLSAVKALGEINNQTAVVALAKAMVKDVGISTDACEALLKSPANLSEAIPVLLAGLKYAIGKKDSHLCQHAARALGFIGEQAVEAVPILLDALTVGNINVYRSAVEALEKIGMTQQMKLQGYIRALKNIDSSVQIEAAKTLGDIGDRSAVPALAEVVLKHQRNRAVAMEAIMKIKPSEEEKTKAYIKVLRNTDSSIRPSLLRVLSKIGDRAALKNLCKLDLYL